MHRRRLQQKQEGQEPLKRRPARNYSGFGHLKTPQLRYLVRTTSTPNQSIPYGKVSEVKYHKKLAGAFTEAVIHAEPNRPVIVDCVRGVSESMLKGLRKELPAVMREMKVWKGEIGNHDLLNEKCGADSSRPRRFAVQQLSNF